MTDPNGDEGIYDFADKTPPPPQTVVPPQPVYDPANPPVLAYRSAKFEKREPAEVETVKNVYLPLWLLGGGVFIEMLAILIWSDRVARDFMEMSVDLTIGTGVMLLAMLIAARLWEIDLGKLGVAAYKLAAISVAPTALAKFLLPVAMHIPMGILVVWAVEFIVFFALLGALFDLQESETWFCVWTIFLTRLGFYFLMRVVFGA